MAAKECTFLCTAKYRRAGYKKYDVHLRRISIKQSNKANVLASQAVSVPIRQNAQQQGFALVVS